MRIAVVGDVHGHLSLLYAILGRWRRETGKAIDLILQVGDLGAFSAGAAIDAATRHHAKTDPEELGFAEFEGERPPATLLDPRPPLVFIPGNHEDFELLERREAAVPAGQPVYPVSDDARIMALRSGRIWTFEHPGGALSVAGVSGVAGRAPKPHYHRRLHLADEDALALAEAGTGSADIVISHERPASVRGGFRHDLGGSESLQLMLESIQPPLAFFGHYDAAGEWAVGRTRVFGLTGCGYKGRGTGTVKRRAIVLVEWGSGEPSVEWLEPDWLPSTRPGDWRRWMSWFGEPDRPR
jgi:hypothetical protein